MNGGGINMAVLQQAHKRALAAHHAMVNDALRDAGNTAKSHVRTKSTFQRRSARSLKDNTQVHVVRTAGGRMLRLKWTKPYASYVEHGTKEHFIFPKRSPWLLKFFWAKHSKWMALTYVRHRGTKPYFFGRDAQHEAHRALGWKLADGMRRRVAKPF